VVLFLVHPFLKYWLPVFGWIIFIGINSTDLMSAEHTSRFIGPFLRWFEPNISESTIASVQLFVRKAAHLTEYAILAALLYRALRRGQKRLFRAGISAFFIAGVCAALDEFHQSFVASRTGTPGDVAIDCAGAAAGVALSRIVNNRKANTQTRK
jgi:VanZ family protein